MWSKMWSICGCALVVVGLVACTSQTIPTTEGAESASDVEFTGPWAAEFSASYARASDEFSRKAIKDGAISEQEYSEMIDRFRGCVSGFGYDIGDYELDGSFSLTFPPETSSDVANSDVESCSRQSGEAEIGSLYSWTHRNPDRTDEGSLIVECLVKKAVVPSSYSANDYANDSSRDDYPFVDEDAGREALEECRIDPLGEQP